MPKAREVILGSRSVPAWTLFIEKEALGTDSVVTVLRRLSLWFDVERYFNSNHYSANVVETGVDFRFP